MQLDYEIIYIPIRVVETDNYLLNPKLKYMVRWDIATAEIENRNWKT